MDIMNIREKSGVVNLLSKLANTLCCKLFPEIPKDHPAQGAILMQYSTNMLGFDNAATPIGLKVMKIQIRKRLVILKLYF